MKLRSILMAILLVSILNSCGPKIIKHEVFERDLLEISNYKKTIDNNNSLTMEETEGVLTDSLGFKDIGSYKYTVFFDNKTKELFRIENIERTNYGITENYYFKKGNVICVTVKNNDNNSTKMFMFPEGSSESRRKEIERLFKKGKRFQKAFKKSH